MTLLLALVLVLLGVAGVREAAGSKEVAEEGEMVRVRAREVVKIGEGEEWTGLPEGVLEKVTVEFLDGPLRGEEAEMEHYRGHDPAYDIVPREGETYLATLVYEDGEILVLYIMDYVRQQPLGLLAGLLALLLVVVGGMRGLRALVSLGVTLLAVLYGLLPLLLAGWSPIPVAVMTSAAVTALTLGIIGGWGPKTLAAVTGTTVGVLMAGLLAYVFGNWAHLTGLAEQEAVMLMYLPEDIAFDFQGLLFAGIIIGALGAVMDVTMSVASAVEEVRAANPGLSPRNLFDSGLRVGQDVMGTMANTLVLAYAGTAVPLLLLFMAYDTSWLQAINMEFIATELIRALAGTSGLVLSIPATAFSSAWLVRKASRSRSLPG